MSDFCLNFLGMVFGVFCHIAEYTRLPPRERVSRERDERRLSEEQPFRADDCERSEQSAQKRQVNTYPSVRR